jgi:hypothetical protein
MNNEITKQESEQLATRVSAMHLQMGALMKNIAECLDVMHPLTDAQENAAADLLRDAWVQAIDGPIKEVLAQLPTANMLAFVGALAALRLAHSSINAYGDAFDRDIASAQANKSNVVAMTREE